MEIKLEQLGYCYQKNSPFEKRALLDVNVSFDSGSYSAIIGHTGSGKSTLLQHLNALLMPTEGKITVGDREIVAGVKQKKLRDLRKKVGIVFQFPEAQLFEETVEKDICFGPMNFGVSEEDAKLRAKKVIYEVGLTEEILSRSPFELSGGQMRRVAIAGVLAMDPEVLVLDEPTAGLDPHGREEIMEMFYNLHKEKGLTTVLVTHSMEDAARYAEKIVLMKAGTVLQIGTPREISAKPDELVDLGLSVPDVVRFQGLFERKFDVKLTKTCLTIGELTTEMAPYLAKGGA
ncbi:energizing coupling factor of ABC influx transporter (ATP-binding protein) [Listeria monocytogenes]|uniref:energy-coupling factor ABC transporter ATP-binding protein n=1 Tax=Listeria monocytogenes TaxID=1639 RepID=UPI00074D5554|nr:energy-coupling factor ABC transporter ATP-binding protein [Listeria monocytogenes]EAE7884894.1 energy-coupling factor ABC transporter ATP-binding protein [Listeria monocytogenes]EJQ6754822.1 energy-coupling factor ABC transporter ATP-binding protein [Listeria monocytogenes]CUL92111.1 energizing coupling factor of ABC influx transporter (ATP-binding protein) [Listeria monocytogenes]HEN3926140.1 energy-coupling factor ABC transporter ATP-binding protein [Listeria monocytogenes]HEN3935021.1 e